MPAFRSVVSVLLRELCELLYRFKPCGRPPGGLQQLLRLLWTYYGDRQIVDRVMRRRRRRGFLELAADECGVALAATEA
jgi:hypothetical protein